MMKRFIYILLLGVAFQACSQAIAEPEPQSPLVPVTLDITVNGVAVAEESKAQTSLDPKVENPISNLWILQYDERGEWCHSEYWSTPNPVLSIPNHQVQLKLCPQSTVVVLANVGSLTYNGAKDGDRYRYEWPATIGQMRMLVMADAPELSLDRDAGRQVEKIYMMGEVTLTSSQITEPYTSVNVMLSRLCAKIAVSVHQEKSSRGLYEFEDLQITMLNTVNGFTVLPDPQTFSAAGRLSDYVTEYVSVEQAGQGETQRFDNSSERVTRYFYVNENLDRNRNNWTCIQVSVRGKADGQLRTRIYPVTSYGQLYRNTFYTFDLTVSGFGG